MSRASVVARTLQDATCRIREPGEAMERLARVTETGTCQILCEDLSPTAAASLGHWLLWMFSDENDFAVQPDATQVHECIRRVLLSIPPEYRSAGKDESAIALCE